MSTIYQQMKISEEAKIAIETIRCNYKPDMDMQDILSLAVMEYLHAYYPALEEGVAKITRRRQEARRGDEASHPE